MPLCNNFSVELGDDKVQSVELRWRHHNNVDNDQKIVLLRNKMNASKHCMKAALRIMRRTKQLNNHNTETLAKFKNKIRVY